LEGNDLLPSKFCLPPAELFFPVFRPTLINAENVDSAAGANLGLPIGLACPLAMAALRQLLEHAECRTG